MRYHFLLFATTRDVLKAERACKKNNLPVTIVPVPRTLSSECGMALRVDDTTLLSVKELLKGASIDLRE